MSAPPAAAFARIAAFALRRPGLTLSLCAYAIAAVLAAVLLAALSLPEFGAKFVTAQDGVRVDLDEGRSVLVAPDARVAVTSPAGSLATNAASLVPDYHPSGGSAAVETFFRDRSELARIATMPGATIAFETADGRRFAQLKHRRQTISDLPLDFWLLAIQGAVIGLVGVWLRVNRPREVSSWMFGAACDGVLIAAMSGAVFDARELTADGDLLRTMIGLNYIGSNLAAFGLTALFLYVPRVIAPRWAGCAILAGAVLLGLLEWRAILALPTFYIGLLVSVVALLPIVAIQVRRTRGDPTGRAALRWVGAAAISGATLLCLGMAAPALLGLPPFASDGFSILPLFVIFGGIAFGVGGVRMFELDRWSYRLMLGAAAVLALVVGDLLLVNLVRVESSVALALTLLVAGYAYFPLRAYFWNRITGARTVSNQDLLRQAALVAFLPSAKARRGEWRALLDRLFEPVACDVSSEPVAAPAIAANGEVLLLPPIADEQALRLRFAGRGRRLFGGADLTTARVLVSLLGEAEAARAEYTRGVAEERERIARDLHDDVSSLLLTGLHRTDVTAVRGDVRQALGEIRTMVSSLAGPAIPLTTILADLRFETAERLCLAAVVLDWGIPASPELGTAALDYGHHKALVSGMREMISNILRHAGASRVRIVSTVTQGVLTIEIDDDGCGLGLGGGRREGGRGLANIGHRLHELGGQATLCALDRGCRASLVLPLALSQRPCTLNGG